MRLGVPAFVSACASAVILTVADADAAQRIKLQPATAAELVQAKSRQEVPLPVRPGDKPKSDAERPTKSKDTKSATEGAPAQVPDQWRQEEIISALHDCIRILGPIAAEVDIAVPIKHGACGAAAPVLLRRLGTTHPVLLSPPATVNCPMVAALHRWVETQLQPEARRLLGSHIVSLSNVSAYSCRLRNGSARGKLSEHALANAVDIGRFMTADGQVISVATDWGPTARDIKRAAAEMRKRTPSQSKEAVPPTPARKGKKKLASAHLGGVPLPERRPDPQALEASRERPAGVNAVRDETQEEPSVALKPATSKQAQFLKAIHEGACGLFGTVLGPEANEAHRDHFHFDLAPRRRQAFCE